MDGTMDIAPSVQSSHLPAAPFAGHGLPQHHAGYWHYSTTVLESMHRDQHTPQSFPSSPSYTVEDHPHQHQSPHHTLQAPATPAIVPLTINGQFNEPLPYTEQQSVPVTTSAVLSPLIQLQLNFFNHQQMMLKLNQDLLTQQIKMIETVYSLHLQKRQHQEATPSSVDYPQVIPTITLPHVASQSNDVDSAVVINQQQSMNQLIIPEPTIPQQQQQQQKAQNSIAPELAVPTPHGGISGNKIEYNKQTNQSSGVLNWFGYGPPRKCRSSTNGFKFIKASTVKVTVYDPARPKYLAHLLDRNGHRMDSSRGHASASSDVFEWMVNHGRVNRHKLRYCSIVLVILIIDLIATVRPSSLFLHPKTVAVVNPSTE